MVPTEVRVRYAASAGSVQAVWNLMPGVVRLVLQGAPEDDESTKRTPVRMGLELAESADLIRRVKPARWLHHPFGGAPRPHVRSGGRCAGPRHDVLLP